MTHKTAEMTISGRHTSVAERLVLQHFGIVCDRHVMGPVVGGATLCHVCVNTLVVIVYSNGQNTLRKVLPDHVAVKIVVDLNREKYKSG